MLQGHTVSVGRFYLPLYGINLSISLMFYCSPFKCLPVYPAGSKGVATKVDTGLSYKNDHNLKNTVDSTRCCDLLSGGQTDFKPTTFLSLIT